MQTWNVDAVNMIVRCEVPGDGNCLYHSVADQVERLGMRPWPVAAATLWKEVVSFMSCLEQVSVMCRVTMVTNLPMS